MINAVWVEDEKYTRETALDMSDGPMHCVPDYETTKLYYISLASHFSG